MTPDRRRPALHLAVAGLLLISASAGAQTPSPAPVGPVTDSAPPAAEERGSTGAVVLEKSMVPAQREKAQEAARDAARPGAAPAGSRDATRTLGNQGGSTPADAADPRRGERERGSGAVPPAAR